MLSLNGQLFSIPSKSGFLCAYVKGQGKPLLLVHTVNAAASAAEVRPMFDLMGRIRIFVFEARGVGLIHAVVRLWLTCWPFKAKGTLST